MWMRMFSYSVAGKIFESCGHSSTVVAVCSFLGAHTVPPRRTSTHNSVPCLRRATLILGRHTYPCASHISRKTAFVLSPYPAQFSSRSMHAGGRITAMWSVNGLGVGTGTPTRSLTIVMTGAIYPLRAQVVRASAAARSELLVGALWSSLVASEFAAPPRLRVRLFCPFSVSVSTVIRCTRCRPAIIGRGHPTQCPISRHSLM